MAKTRKRRRGCLGRLIKWLLLAALVLTGYMAINARIVHVERAEVYLTDLPDAFDGTTILWLTDLHMGRFASPADAAKLVAGMQTLYPDLLVLGGDYTGGDELWTMGQESKAEHNRDEFFTQLGWFYTPLGKYGVRGNHDPEAGLEASMALGGVTLMRNEAVTLTKGGQHLILAGLDDWTTGAQDPAGVAAQVRAKDAALVISHNPDALPALLSASDAPWVDLMLSGHTHGGQIAIPWLQAIFTPSMYQDKYLTGWIREGGAVMLVSNGVGATGLPLRFRAPAQAHLITLKKG